MRKMQNAVEVRSLTKKYGKESAVSDVSFTLEPNKIYGLLGRNGAGKTTIMHMIAAQLFPTDGEIRVFGEAPYENTRVLSQVCFIKESQKYPDAFRIIDVLDIAEACFPNWDKAYAHTLIEEFRLPLKRRMKKLSRGMLSSVGIIIGLASRAPLTLFDEPYLGLDAVARSMFYNHLIEDYAEHPRTIVLSTHLIDEVSQLLEHVIVINEGKIMLNEEAESLRGRALTVVGSSAAVETFAAGKQIIEREAFGGLLKVTVIGKWNEDERKRAKVLGLEMTAVSLQQLIVHLTGGNSDRKAVSV